MDPFDDFCVRMWRPPLVRRFDSDEIADLSDPKNVVMLALALATEIEMGGLVTYLGNSVGRFARETVDALFVLDQPSSAEALADAVAVADSVGMTHERIRADRSTFATGSVASFNQIHGTKWQAATTSIHTLEGDVDVDAIRDAAATWFYLFSSDAHDATHRSSRARKGKA